jgi:hypothetical protein
MIGGRQAAQKGQKVAESIIQRVTGIYKILGFADFRATDIEVLGSEGTYGEHSRGQDCREVVVKIAVHHDDKKALGLFAREIAQAATAMAPGLTGLVGGRPKPSPMIRLFSFLLPKKDIPVSFTINGETQSVDIASGTALEDLNTESTALAVNAAQQGEVDLSSDLSSEVPLIALAVARSGDKGDHCNVGVMARDESYLPYIQAALNPELIRPYVQHVLSEESTVTLYELPGLNGFNLMLEHALGGGGIASLRIDPQGKAMAQQLLDMPVKVPADIAEQAKQNYQQLTGETI